MKLAVNFATVRQNSAALRVLLVLAVLLLAFGPLASPAAASAPAPDTATAKFEVRFMEDMIEHHMMAVEMAEMCVDKAVHPELASLCQNIISAQMMEIEEMRTWLMDWYGIDYLPEMKVTGEMMHMEMMEGAAFEEHFLKMMIRHHWGAIVEARHAVDRSYHTELRQLGENIIPSQSQEIEQMRTWLRVWYGYQNFGPQLN
ncbi:MAG: DUF305 domain-containing protein [Chloroflexota bacterium]